MDLSFTTTTPTSPVAGANEPPDLGADANASTLKARPPVADADLVESATPGADAAPVGDPPVGDPSADGDVEGAVEKILGQSLVSWLVTQMNILFNQQNEARERLEE
ncbi:MAG: hypothetical protein AAFX50_22730 [Acidobacteriota bacterium]